VKGEIIIWLIGLIFITACSSQTAESPTLTPQFTAEATEFVAEAEPAETAVLATDMPEPQPTAEAICTTSAELATDPAQLGWWNSQIFYEIFVRSFYDSDGDGIGDFNGLVEKLDYLNDGDPNTSDDLGITGIWLMPITASPSYHGYDVTDYFAVNPEYGTMEEFQNLLDEAHQRGIRVIIDMVLNHTSVQHPWFQEANSDVNSPYRDYYIFEASSPGFDSPWGSEVWHRATAGGFYYAIFWEGMPDLDYNNPDVTADMQEVIRFWLEDVGVDGFRLDAIKHLIEEGEIQENTMATHTWWEGFYDHYTSINPEAFTVGEAWSATSEVVKYIGDEVNIAFEFDLAEDMIETARRDTNLLIVATHDNITRNFPPHQYATFLANHDQDRVMSQLLGNVERAKTAASLLLTGPGVPFLYYGEEVGQSGRKPDENIRTPMQWSAEANAGFTTAERAWRSPQADFDEVNVAAQAADANSLLSHYQRLIQARSRYEALQWGDWQEMPTSHGKLYAFLRRTAGQTLLVLINLGDEAITDYRFCLSDSSLSEGSASEILMNTTVAAPTLNASGGFDNYTPLAELAPYSTYIIELK
jgi:glycosidase